VGSDFGLHRGDCCHSGQHFDEIGALRRPHSITSSARARTVGGISSPSALAVLR
jgi:hypothetical protein